MIDEASLSKNSFMPLFLPVTAALKMAKSCLGKALGDCYEEARLKGMLELCGFCMCPQVRCAAR